MRDTAPALQSITKHNHMARAGEDSFDSEQRGQGWKGGAFQTWTEAQRAGRPRGHTGLHACPSPTSHLCPGVGLCQNSCQAGVLNYRTDGVSKRPEAQIAHKHRVPDSMGKGNCALVGPSPSSLAS